MEFQYLLSICIPTRNRAAYLHKSLKSLTSSEFFINHLDIEVVISDNASTDDTESIVQTFINQHGERIRYFKNQEDLQDQNFEVVLHHGRGIFLKLINDTALWQPNALESVYRLVLKNLDSRPVLFWLNGGRQVTNKETFLQGLDTFVRFVSFHMGWIGAFGIWREQLVEIGDLTKIVKTKLIQVHVLLRIISRKPDVVVSNEVCFRVQDVGPKGGYSLAKVFAHHYLDMLRSYPDLVSELTVSNEKKKVLLEHILPYHFHRGHRFFAIHSKKF